ncbi:MAG: S9 family peptidase [Deltaproteobacteria bacterium]|nr:S9 family peptidase [Deltaproteobacteria bacterium]
MTPLTLIVALATATPNPPPAASSYAGHGADSVPAEVLERFRAPALAREVSLRVQAMLDVRAPSGGLLAPDGRSMFVTWGVTGVRQVWRLDGPMRFPVQLTGGEDPTSLVDVTADGTTLVLQRDRAGEENPGLYLQSAKGGPLVVIKHEPKVQTQAQLVTDDGKYLYFRANDKKPDSYALYRFVFATKQIEPVFAQDGLWSIAGRLDRERRLLLALAVGSNQQEIFELDETTHTLTPLFGQGEHEDYEVGYGAGGDVLVLTPKLSEFRRLYRFDRKLHAFTAITPELSWDVDSFAVSRDDRWLFTRINEGGRTRTRLFDARSLKEVGLPLLPPGDHVVLGPAGRVKNAAVLSVDTGTAPATSAVLDLGTKKLTTWHVPSAPEVELASFVAVSVEEYPARDGTRIPMLVRRPATCAKASTPCPVIVDFHGGPEAQATTGFSPRAQLFVDAGFIHVQPNVRGSDGYGKSWIHADDGAKRLQVITDIEDAARFVRASWGKGGKAPKVGIFGGSYGGYSVLMGMTRFAGAYDAGVDVVGISSLVTFLENTAPYRRALRISEYGDPVADRAALVELSPITHVGKTTGPVLLLQGATDPRVPVEEAIQMYDAMQAKKLPAQLIIFPDEGHGVQKRVNQVQLLGHAIAFFQRHLVAP